jgi:hypothetical protein
MKKCLLISLIFTGCTASDTDTVVETTNNPTPSYDEAWSNGTNYSIVFNGSNSYAILTPGGTLVMADEFSSCAEASSKREEYAKAFREALARRKEAERKDSKAKIKDIFRWQKIDCDK